MPGPQSSPYVLDCMVSEARQDTLGREVSELTVRGLMACETMEQQSILLSDDKHQHRASGHARKAWRWELTTLSQPAGIVGIKFRNVTIHDCYLGN